MFSMLTMSLILMFITSLMMFMATILSKKTFYDREKNSPFECGFDPKSSARLPFSLRFFLITIIFLIFDVEIVLLFPIIPILQYSNMFIWSITTMFFIIILLIGLFHEWAQGALEWNN
uniref:NADH-ubiquinone oxidoreductase chain 3 n=1 Tax=Sciara ruficauda TaxID=1260812 RepID=A0A6G7GBH3_9DIPT|nr:NADH dehydrogenase subunit 3 [Sciara ruficauda]QIH95757.1 NADH dehydrogenase subunit 3 [Sciara ruficauda]